MSKLMTPVNIGLAGIAVVTAIGWALLDRHNAKQAEQTAFRDAFFKVIATDTDKSGVSCQGCWLHELNRDHTVMVDIKRHVIDIPRLDNIDLSGADLSGAYFNKAIAINSNFSGAILDMARFELANLSNANLSGARLRGAKMRNANLSGANLSGADLSPKKDTSWLRVFHAEFEQYGGRTDLKGTQLSGVDFSDADLTGVMMKGAKGNDSAIFCNTVMPDGTISNRNCK